MAEPDNLVLSPLRAIRSSMQALREDVDTRFNTVDADLADLRRRDSVKQAAFGEPVLGRYAVAEVEERLVDIEQRLKALEGRS